MDAPSPSSFWFTQWFPDRARSQLLPSLSISVAGVGSEAGFPEAGPVGQEMDPTAALREGVVFEGHGALVGVDHMAGAAVHRREMADAAKRT